MLLWADSSCMDLQYGNDDPCPLTIFEGGLNLVHEADDDSDWNLQRLQHWRNKQVIAPAARRYAPADGSSTRDGSTSVSGQVRSPHISGGRQTNGSRYRLPLRQRIINNSIIRERAPGE